ncbi:MAG: hypothetical protein AABX34_00540 [Nanoarchaeota archaeon]
MASRYSEKEKNDRKKWSNKYSSLKKRGKVEFNSPQELKKWYESKNKCEYCGLTEDVRRRIHKIAEERGAGRMDLRGKPLEIDRFNPKKPYGEKNCRLACYWCNNAKTDFFDGKEFEPIGKAIGKALRSIIKKRKIARL